MNYVNGEVGQAKKVVREQKPLAALKDVPLEDRRKEAKKPLFLTRYE